MTDILELAKQVQSNESDKSQEIIMLYPNELEKLEALLREKFITELDSGEAVAWAVAECWSSSSPKREVLCLADSPEKIKYFESHHSFIRWASSPQKQWVELNREQLERIYLNNNSLVDIAKAISNALKEVNHG